MGFTVNKNRFKKFPLLPDMVGWLSPERVSKACLKSPHIYAALDCWLKEHPAVAAEITWSSPDMSGMAWPDWPEPLKNELRVHFWDMINWYHSGMPAKCPTPFPVPLPKSVPGDPAIWGGLCMLEPTAKSIYFSHVANSLAAELLGTFPWTIANYTDAELTIMFGCSKFFGYHSAAHTQYPGYYPQCNTSMATPGYVVSFFKTNSLLGNNALDTVSNFYIWCNRLYHYFTDQGDASVNYQNFWPNSPPIAVSQIIEGTTYTGKSKYSPPLFAHFTGGCVGTTEFMQFALRAINIPAEKRTTVCLHVMPFFSTIDRTMSHGDDPYSRMTVVSPFPGWPVPTKQEYLITGAQWNQWFGPGIDYNTCGTNIGRQIGILAVQYLSDGLLKWYCQDLKAQASHANGEVFHNLSLFFTLAELEAKQLWQKLDAKATATNFCSQFP